MYRIKTWVNKLVHKYAVYGYSVKTNPADFMVEDLATGKLPFRKKTRIRRNAVSRLPALFHKIEVNL